MLVEAINQAGVHHFVGKPWDADALRGIVAEAIRHRDLLRAAG
jgi:response regulator RpfG family c-di-GMP phosphodiesterase